jgi:uncharacterized protein YegP (UPF0339 family)
MVDLVSDEIAAQRTEPLWFHPHLTFQIYRSLTLAGRRWFWRAVARNGEIVASGEGYRHKADVLNVVELIVGNAQDAPIEWLD